jgi:hypothetical protein
MNVMRKSVTGDRDMRKPLTLLASSKSLARAARFAAVAIGVGMILGNSVARAQDADDDDSTFEEKIIKNLMGSIGATNMDNRGIDYRERSPLVIPPKVELPPPVSASAEVNAPNWPKDPDATERERIRKINKQKKVTGNEGARPLMPDELAAHRTKHVATTEPMQPGASPSPMLSPSQLGFKGNMLSKMFGGNTTESAPFTGEPERDSLTQPPVGYQTPSPNFAYGTGPKQPLGQGGYNIMTGKEVK